MILINVGEELLCAEDLGDLHQLVIVVFALEEGLLLEDHASEHAPQRPNIETIIVHLQIYKQLGTFKVARGDTNVVLLARVIKLGEAPINES